MHLEAYGSDLSTKNSEQNIERTRPMVPYRPSSMIDCLDGREVELDAIWAAPIRRAAAVGAPMPATADLLERIRQRIDTSAAE